MRWFGFLDHAWMITNAAAVWIYIRYIEATNRNTLLAELRCKIALEDSLDLSVDLIVKEPGKDKPIYNLAKAQGVRL